MCFLLDARFFQFYPLSSFLLFSAWTNVESDSYRQLRETGAGLFAVIIWVQGWEIFSGSCNCSAQEQCIAPEDLFLSWNISRFELSPLPLLKLRTWYLFQKSQAISISSAYCIAFIPAHVHSCDLFGEQEGWSIISQKGEVLNVTALLARYYAACWVRPKTEESGLF